MAKLMAPNIRIDWYPEGHFQDIHNPTIAELNSGVNLSCAVVTGYTLDFTDSNTEDTTTIFDTFTSEDILNHSYEADLEFFLAPRGSNADNEEAYRKAEELFYNPENRVGYLAKRFGFPWYKEYNIEQPRQHVDLFKVQADLPKVVSEDGAPILLNVKYIPQGEAVSSTKAGTLTYEWEGVPHASTSVKIVDGEVVARNLATNPSFETSAANGWRKGSHVGFDSTTAIPDRVKNGTQARVLRWDSGAIEVQTTTYVRLDNVSQGDWVAVSGWITTTQASTLYARPNVSEYTAPGDYLSHNPQPFYTLLGQENMTYLEYAYQLKDPTVGQAQVGFYFSNNRTFESPTGFAYLDAVNIAVADTEQEALAQVEHYFDGDSVDK